MKKISGTMYAYSYLCWRKLWFFAKDIVMEQENENVMIGKLIDEESYKRDKKHIYLDDFVCIDIVRDNVICEIKKKLIEARNGRATIKILFIFIK